MDKTILLYEVMSGPMYLVRSDECGAHNMLKPKYYLYRSKEKDTWIVRIYPSRYKTVSLCRPDLYQVSVEYSLYFMAWSRAPYIHIILADVVSITCTLISH